MNKKIDSKILIAEVKAKIRFFYPYLLGFYIFSLLVAIFSKDWARLFHWSSFHGVVIFFTLLFLATFEFTVNIKKHLTLKDFKLKRELIVTVSKNSAHRAYRELRKYFYYLKSKLDSLSRRNRLKIVIIFAVIIFAIFKEVNIFDLLVLFYALISILFILDSRYAAGAALGFLASCPILLILKKDLWAEGAAIYAYYFLVITVITQIRELKKEEKKKLF